MTERRLSPNQVVSAWAQARLRATAQASELIGEHIRLKRELGRGATSVVWEGQDEWTKERVAVKMLRPGLAHDEATLLRFETERRVLSMVGEAAGIGLRSAGAYGGVPYLELDLARGESLAERIERTQGLPPNQVFAIVRQLLQRLDAIHEAGIVHRDIKPGNIVVGGGEGRALEVAVVDFGIATKAHAADLSEEDAMSGTAPYMGPEHMFRLGDIDGRMDLWSAAVVAYECLTGRPAFGNESLGLICLAVDAGQYIPPSQFVPSLPPAVDAWFARAFRRNILARFQCARDMERAWVSAHAATIGRRDTPPMAMPPRTRMAA